MMSLFTLLGAGLATAYLEQMVRFRRAWQRLPVHSAATPSDSIPEAGPAFSILVAARNEAATLPGLLADLARQLPVRGGFEVLIVDDHSTDTTAALVAQTAAAVPFPLRLLRLADNPTQPTGKKAAIAAAIAAARAPWLLLTDADCRVPAGWVRAYAAVAQAEPAVQFISGPVLLTGQGWLATLQGLELAGLVGVGAASIGLNAPTMCNGANLAYRRAAFEAVRGFAGNEAIASGDDEFLLHKLHQQFSEGIRFLKTPEAVVRTAAQPTLRRLLAQRVRWASKWQHYQTAAPRQLAVMVLLANLLFPLGALLWWFRPQDGLWILGAWLLKLLGDGLLLGPVLRFLGRPGWLTWVPILQLAYGPYALLVGLLGLRGGYEWKGRQVRALKNK
ncbi:glycosyltransferase [Hymenobacter sp. J193]|uniref:glycosyltransferase n=1 Tax=Hymenobacter sp. J193 TaxID=2898429 RepID=UPI0021510B18|nr:glycosyltransferase [Hymenobacter sp. J193]MCR5889498.1 glycosyltransferase [Hymenobacter sp. J193]